MKLKKKKQTKFTLEFFKVSNAKDMNLAIAECRIPTEQFGYFSFYCGDCSTETITYTSQNYKVDKIYTELSRNTIEAVQQINVLNILNKNLKFHFGLSQSGTDGTIQQELIII